MSVHRFDNTMQRGRARRRDLTRRLPVEILAIIFQNLKDLCYPHYRGLSAKWIRVTWVCKRWRQVALQTPTLWSSALISQGIEDDPALETQLDRARGAALDVFVSNRDMSDNDVGDALGLVLARRSPIRTLEVDCHMHQAALQDFIKTVASDLVSLSTNEWIDDETEFSSDIVPRLRHLTLCGIIPLAGGSLPNLTRLSLAHAYDEDAVPPGMAVHRFLSACPNLEELRMNNCFIYDNEDMIEMSGGHILPIVTLPKLRYLSLDQLACDVATALGTLRLPALSSFRVEADCNNGYTSETFPVVPQNITEALPPIRGSRSFALVAGGDVETNNAEVRLRGGPGVTGNGGVGGNGDDWSVTVFGLIDRVTEDEDYQHLCCIREYCGLFLARVPQLIVSSDLIRLELHVSDGLPVARDWVRFFTGMPRLRTLVVGSGALIRLVLEAFKDFQGEEERRLCPELEDLDLCVGMARNPEYGTEEGALAKTILRALGTWLRARATPLRSLTVRIPNGPRHSGSGDFDSDLDSSSDADSASESLADEEQSGGGGPRRDIKTIENWAWKLCQDVGLTLKGSVLKVFLVRTGCPACGVVYEQEDGDAIGEGELSNDASYY